MRMTKKQEIAARTCEAAREIGANIKDSELAPNPDHQQGRDDGIKLVLAAIPRLLYGDAYAALIDAAGYRTEQTPHGTQRLIRKAP